MPNWDDGFEAAIREVIPPDNHSLINPDVKLADIGLDSMGVMQLVTLLEDSYDIVFPVEYVNADVLATPSTLWSVVTAVRTEAG
jgi:acyl carrier protein